MTTLERLLGRAFGRPIRRMSPARVALAGLATVLAVAGVAVVLQPSPVGPGPVAYAAAPDLSPGIRTRTDEEAEAIAKEAEANAMEDATASESSPAVATLTPPLDFWHFVGGGGGGTGPVYTSLTGLGERSGAVVVGSYTGDVTPGREPCDEESLAGGAPREQACVFFANLTFRIDEVLAGGLPEQHRETVKLEYMVDQGGPSRLEALEAAVPPDQRVVLFIRSKDPRRGDTQDVYYAVGQGTGTFRDVDGRVVPLAAADDTELGRLEGMPFEQFVELVRRVPILDLMPQG